MLKTSKLRACLWDISHRCNRKCPHCFNSCGAELHEGPSLGECHTIQNRLKHLGFESLFISGGEPFLRSDIEDIVQHGADAGLKMGMVTNGTLCTPERLDKLRPSLTILGVSIDSHDKDVNDSLRFSGSYDATVQTCKTAQQLGIPFYFSSTIQSTNKNSIAPLRRLSKQLGARSVYFKGVFNKNYNEASLDDFIAALDIQHDVHPNTECYAYSRSMYLDPDATLYPCQMLAYASEKYQLGNLLEMEDEYFNLRIFGGAIKSSQQSCPFLFFESGKDLICTSPVAECPMKW